MKKTISNIFDEAKANEIENLVNQNTASDLSSDTLSAIKNKVYAKTGISKTKKKPFRLRWKSCVAIVACLSVVVGVCVGVWGVDSDPEIKEYVIYASLTSSSDTSETEIYKNGLRENVSTGDIYQKDFALYESTEVNNSKAVRSKKFSLNGKSMDLTYSMSFEKPLASTKIGQDNSLGKYDRYSYGKDIIEFKYGTDELLFYMASIYNVDRRAEGNFTADEAKNAAGKLLKELYGEKKLNEYTFEAVDIFEDSIERGYWVLYVKYVHGVKTEDEILVKYNMKGELTSINAMQMGYFDQAEKDLKKADIEAAEKALRDSIHESYETNEVATITMDTSGEYYLWIFASRVSPTTGKEEGAKFYINIE